MSSLQSCLFSANFARDSDFKAAEKESWCTTFSNLFRISNGITSANWTLPKIESGRGRSLAVEIEARMPQAPYFSTVRWLRARLCMLLCMYANVKQQGSFATRPVGVRSESDPCANETLQTVPETVSKLNFREIVSPPDPSRSQHPNMCYPSRSVQRRVERKSQSGNSTQLL